MKLFEEFKLYENMWDDTDHKENFSKKADLDFKRALIKALKDDNNKSLAKQIQSCDVISSSDIDPDTISIENGIVKIPTNLYSIEKIDKVIEIITQVVSRKAKKSLGNLDEATMPWEAEVAQADNFLDAIVKATGNENYDDGDGYWEAEGKTWCNRYLYYGNSLNNTSLVKDLCAVGSTKIPNANFYYTEDDMEEDPVSEIGYTLTKASVTESGCKGTDCKKKILRKTQI